jgi:transcriptional regulator with XRE-family HTH domain
LPYDRGCTTLPGVPPPAAPDPALARALLALRQRSGQSQESLAHAAGLTVTAYARLERGQTNPTWATVRAVARALDLSLAQLGKAIDQAEH